MVVVVVVGRGGGGGGRREWSLPLGFLVRFQLTRVRMHPSSRPGNCQLDDDDDDDDVELNVLGCRVDILGTNCDQCVCTVQCCSTSTETVRLIRTGSPGRPPRTFTQLLNSEPAGCARVTLSTGCGCAIFPGQHRPSASRPLLTQQCHLYSYIDFFPPRFSSMLLYVHRDHKNYLGWGAQDGHLDCHSPRALPPTY